MTYDIKDIINLINMLALDIGRVTIMEVCGTHTSSIQKYGIPSILHKNIQLVSGPGCPVCVTSQEDILKALNIAEQEDVIFTCFGDMIRVHCGDKSLYSLKENGSNIRIVTSPMESLLISKKNPDKKVVYFAVGFETTAPHTAVLIDEAKKQKVKNIYILNSHKTMPQALLSLLGGINKVQALICPGHVAAVIGSDAFMFVPEKLKLPAAVAGFEAYDILSAILGIMVMIKKNHVECINMYPQVVTKGGNKKALEILYSIMEPGDGVWRGLGLIPGSGLKLRKEFSEYDACNCFNISISNTKEPTTCICSKILRGESIPYECSYFGTVCTPESPVGPCMVSQEGSCFIYYNKGELIWTIK